MIFIIIFHYIIFICCIWTLMDFHTDNRVQSQTLVGNCPVTVGLYEQHVRAAAFKRQNQLKPQLIVSLRSGSGEDLDPEQGIGCRPECEWVWTDLRRAGNPSDGSSC